MRYSVRCGGTEAAAGLLLVALCVGSARAQAPVLRVDGPAGRVVEGVQADGAALFPAHTLERLGFRLAGGAAEFTAVLGTDTLRFWATSPFFRAGAAVHQLAFPVTHAGDAAWIPEEFFIRWLPGAYPQQYAFRGGALVTQAGTPASAAAPRTPAPGSEARRAAARTRVVVIDPGHGGRDPGNIAINGMREKDFTLLIGQRLASVLRERGYEVHLTRTTDTLIALADRPRLANRWKGDRPVAVFLSIHANSFRSSGPRGFETFFLSEARTEDERRVAEMENEAIRFEDDAARPSLEGLDQILANLHSDFLMRASHDLAAVTQDRIAAFHPGPNRGVKRAGFHVLVGAIMPAILIEAGFMSNREEASLLGTSSFQQKISVGIADAVDEFFRRNEHLWVQE